jgi:hypothetical protein
MYGVKPQRLTGLFKLLLEKDSAFIAIEIKHVAGCPGGFDVKTCTCPEVDVTLRSRL